MLQFFVILLTPLLEFSIWKYKIKKKNINILPCYWNINFYAIDVSVNRQMTLKLFMALATEHKEPTENRIWWQSVIETDDANNIVWKSIKLNVKENKNAPIHQHNNKNIESIKCIKKKYFSRMRQMKFEHDFFNNHKSLAFKIFVN